MVDVQDCEAYGKEGDGTRFSRSFIGRQMYSETLFPADTMLPNSETKLPYIVVGDEAFRLHRHLLKPYRRPNARADNRKTIFNYRLSRARRVSENAFGLLSQIFFTPIALKPETCDKLIMVACCLHIMLRDAYLENSRHPFYENKRQAEEPIPFTPLPRLGGFANSEGLNIREQFMTYFNEEGRVDWQDRHISRTVSATTRNSD
ncbi:hypothetical protein NQ317_007933 [Molorchus minor]|uniref:DDE Tnp4 domain-containing protein n=1 Tax=Molorchus minor TaxID=1323400 RepID=A0ABQ9JSF5_9CUCU|nr:hypothetical protein NQ317_007933 [Molorchus minor]